jgi:hypothetical protein
MLLKILAFALYRMFRSETGELRQLVQEVILSKKISYTPWVNSASLLQYGPK